MATAPAATAAAPHAASSPPPGRRALRTVLAVGPLLVALGVVVVLTVGDRPLLGTNRVGPASFFAVVPAGGTVCTGGAEHVPAGTGEVVVRTSTSQDGPLGVSIRGLAHGVRNQPYESGDTA